MNIHEMADGLRKRLLEEGAATAESCGHLSHTQIMKLRDEEVIEIFITRPKICKGTMIPYVEAVKKIESCNSVKEFYDELNRIASRIMQIGRG